MYKLICIITIIFLLLGQGSAANAPSGEEFKIGLVRDLFLRYEQQDSFIYYGVQFWANWVNQRGGL